MEAEKLGGLLRQLRQEQKLTQAQLGRMIGVSDKAVSKWERGLGFPDLSVLPGLCQSLAVEPQALLAGNLGNQAFVGGNMKKLQFYVCPQCGNLITATAKVQVSCCGRLLSPMTPQAPGEEDPQVAMSLIDQEWYLSSEHEMTREHYIPFAAILTDDKIYMKRCYPQWDLSLTLPYVAKGRLLWYCTKHGLFYRDFRPSPKGKG